MAGEGLFFAGTVLKNNRNLLEEEATRQQLDMQREELELKKQAAADKRKDARKKNEVNPNSYSLDGMDTFLADQFQGEVSEYQSFVNENSLNFDDNLELKNQKLKDEGSLNISGSRYKSISTDLTSYQNLITNGKGDKLALAEDGSYLYDYNYKKIQEEVNKRKANPDEGMTFDEAIEAYPIDVNSAMKRTTWIDPTIALFAADNENRQGSDDDDDGYNYSSISDSQKNITQTAIKNKLTVNSQGFHNDTNYKRIYDTKQLTIEGNEISAKDAFFLEAYIDPETDQLAEITGADKTLLDMLDPESNMFDKKVSNAYAEYLGKKISEEGYKDMTREKTGKVVGETSAEKKAREVEESQMEYNVNTTETIASNETADSQGTGYQTHYDTPGLKVTLEKKNITETITFADIQNGGSSEADDFKNKAKDAQSNAVSAKVKVMGVTLDSRGIPVVLVKLVDRDGNPLAGDAYQVFVRYDILADKIPELSGANVKQLVNYKKPETKTTAGDFDNG